MKKPTDAWCEKLIAKHRVYVEESSKPAMYALIRDAFKEGSNSDHMKIEFKQKGEKK